MKTLIKIFVLAINLFISEQAMPELITWQRGYSINLDPEFNWATSIVEKSNGGFIVIGNVRPEGMFAMGINPYGDSLWYRTYSFWGADSKIINLDSNYLIMSGRNQLIKIDSAGNILWTSLPPTFDFASRQIRLIDDNLYISGMNRNTEKPFFSKKNRLGIHIFYKEYPNLSYGTIFDFINYSTEFIVYGNLLPSREFVNRLDSSGNLILKNLNVDFISGTTLVRFPEEQSLMLGGGEQNRATLMKTDLEGKTIWKKFYDPGSPIFGKIHLLLNDHNGGLISLSDQAYNVHFKTRLIKFDYEGNVLWNRVYGFDDDQLFATYMIQTRDSGYSFVSGRTKLGYNFQVIKTDKIGNVHSTSVLNNSSSIPEEIALFQNYPNPFNSSTIIKFELNVKTVINLSLFDLNGKLVQVIESKILNQGIHEIHYEPELIASGIYFLILKTPNKTLTQKVICIN